MSEMFVGIDLGGTNIKIGLFDSELKLINKTSVATKVDMGPEVVIDKMAQTAKKLLAEAGLSLQDVVAVGIGTPGPAKYSEGIIIKSTNMPTFKNVPICRMLNERLGAPIVFDNDVAYSHYQVIFTAIRGPVGGSVNSMQIAEVELLGVYAD